MFLPGYMGFMRWLRRLKQQKPSVLQQQKLIKRCIKYSALIHVSFYIPKHI